jgi:NADP-dependent 3-hydroxy acid dehydrogenase YdfG
MPAGFDVMGKVVFITGAGHGIGNGIAQVRAEGGSLEDYGSTAQLICPARS